MLWRAESEVGLVGRNYVKYMYFPYLVAF